MGPEGDDLERTQVVASDGAAALRRFAALRRGGVFAERYDLRERLGAGGAGEVFRAHDRLAGVDVALKILYPHAGDDEPEEPAQAVGVSNTTGAARGALARLRRELKLVRSLDHPGIVRVHDLGEHDGLFYIVMDLLRGETLRARLARGAVGADEAARIAAGMLDALARAHAAGIVHRDIKPANVFLVRDAAAPEAPLERVVLLDFGLARDSRGNERLTATGAFLGTPEYVSPEQARGDAVVGPPSDVYSAGIVLWEMLAGAPPFVGSSAIEIVHRHLGQPLPAHGLPRSVPPRLRTLTRWMLEKDARARPRGAGDALACLAGGRRVPWRRRLALGLPRRRVLAVPQRGALGLPRRGAFRYVATAAAVALVFAGVVLFPVRVEAEGNLVRWVDVLHYAPLAVQTPVRIERSLPLGDRSFTSDQLLAFEPRIARAPGPDPFPLSVGRAARWSRRVEPFRLEPAALWAQGPPHGVPRFDRRMRLVAVEPLPWPTARGRRGFVLAYNHIEHYPSLLAAIDDEGHVDWVLPHPGSIIRPLLLDAATRSVVFAAINNELGSRTVIGRVGTPMPASDADRTRWLVVPPYSRTRAGEVRAAFYTPLSTGLYAQLAASNGQGVVHQQDSELLRFDLEQGCPLGRKAREGLEEWAWKERTAEVETALFQAAPGNDGERADPELLLVIARRDDVPRASRGMALYRAMQILRAAGRLEEAYDVAQRGVALEPEVPGHARAVVDLATRLGRHRVAAPDDLARRSTGRGVTPELARDRVIAALIAGETVAATQESWGAQTNGYGAWDAGLIALHGGDAAGAAQALAASARDFTGNAFLRALALSVAPDPRCDEALSDLAFAESGEGSGWALPLVPLRAQLARRCPGAVVAPSSEEIELALADQRRAARTNIVDLYFVPWGEHLAYGTPPVWGPELVRRVHGGR